MQRKKMSDMTPTEFEKCCYEILRGNAEEKGYKNFEITHNKIVQTQDGGYQIDIYSKFMILDFQFVMLCECKRYASPVKRDVVLTLHGKLNSIGAQKGAIISTSGFQSGAIKYAKEHGIALIKAEDYNFEFISHSADGLGIVNEDDPFNYAETHMPSFVAYDYTADTEEPRKVYPTKTMIEDLLSEQNRLIEELMNISLNVSAHS